MMASLHNALFQLALPEIVLVVAALLVLSIDLLALRAQAIRMRFGVAVTVATIGCVAAIARIVMAAHTANVLDGMLVANPLTQLVQVALLVMAIVTLLIAVDSKFTENVGEFVLIVLLATAGMMFMVASRDILVIFVALELLSLSLYILAGFDKHSPRSAEAALKYFLFGGMSAGFLLYGFSLLYGMSNSTKLASIALAVQGTQLNPLLIIALVTTVIGFAFKVAAAPLHFWAPDAYEGAPLPSAALIASSSKVASFFIFYQVMTVGFAGVEGTAWPHGTVGWVPLLALVAVLSMVLGNVAALAQSSVRRLLAYSAIGHAGYMLLAIVSHTGQSLSALVYYVITYGLTTLGAFAVVGVVQEKTGGDKLEDFAGLSRRSPVLAASMFVFMLSLAGIPPLAGFFGKFYLFVSVLGAGPRPIGLVWMVGLAIAMSAVSLYYYLQVLKRVFVAAPAVDAGKIDVPWLRGLVIVLLAAGVVVLGCAPHLLLKWILLAAAQ
ncbi:MAG TPA: NADH-quinone oxidoreductase subunit N [Acidobacteriaceae bacterium]